MGTLSLMYHRFNENKYPSTNIQMEIFIKQINLIEENKQIVELNKKCLDLVTLHREKKHTTSQKNTELIKEINSMGDQLNKIVKNCTSKYIKQNKLVRGLFQTETKRRLRVRRTHLHPPLEPFPQPLLDRLLSTRLDLLVVGVRVLRGSGNRRRDLSDGSTARSAALAATL